MMKTVGTARKWIFARSSEGGKNGMTHTKNGNSDWIKWVLGIIIVTVLPFMANAIINNDKEARTRDEKIREQVVSGTIDKGIKDAKQDETLAKMDNDLKWIKEGINDIKVAMKI